MPTQLQHFCMEPQFYLQLFALTIGHSCAVTETFQGVLLMSLSPWFILFSSRKWKLKGEVPAGRGTREVHSSWLVSSTESSLELLLSSHSWDPSLPFGANLHDDLTNGSRLLIYQQWFSFKACCDLFSSGLGRQWGLLPGDILRGAGDCGFLFLTATLVSASSPSCSTGISGS